LAILAHVSPPRAIALIQARLSSTRLPGKVLLPLGDATVLDHVVARTRRFAAQALVCTSDDPSDDPIEAHCRDHDIACVRGPLDDVFARFVGALAEPIAERTAWFFRVTADCPLVSERLARALLAHAHDGIDHLGVAMQRCPLGVASELVRRSTFESLADRDLDAAEREHVTLRLHERPDEFRCERIEPPMDLQAPDLRLTLDYPQDYDMLQQVFSLVSDPTAASAIALLRARPDLAAVNRDLRQRLARGMT